MNKEAPQTSSSRDIITLPDKPDTVDLVNAITKAKESNVIIVRDEKIKQRVLATARIVGQDVNVEIENSQTF
jgi:hypothetical protein